ncbi:uncharacterized protein FMAN_05093 [Fusarium mangiferae]|uniref:Fucose-specific lectin n=1 Tax=Fusarium mangiferae TaxID=192010 RepID=A0A1L7UKG2_FUSMA|nr:uncharacterized protein FMAN_05093 [Fusarium mangiferae]CVL08287.1 uncharacterized protein FMAN_05093 [Fusarium mangiferae]
MSTTCNCHSNNTNGATQQNVDYSKMHALTAILNPQTLGRAGKKSKVLLYQSLTQNGSWNSCPGQPWQSFTMSPVLKLGSNLVSLVVDDVVHVYGVTAHDSSICLLSPVYQPLKEAKIGLEMTGKIVGCTDGKGTGWIYYQSKDSEKRGCIWEKNLSKPNDRARKIGDSEKAMLGTDIVAFHDGKRRWIVYQNWTNDNVSEVEMVCCDDKSILTIKNTSNAIDEKFIEIAATTAVNTKTNKNMMYIYFRDHKAQLQVYAAEINDNAPKFRAPSEINVSGGLGKLDLDSSIAFLPDKDGIVIYAIPDGGDSFDSFFDEFSD